MRNERVGHLRSAVTVVAVCLLVAVAGCAGMGMDDADDDSEPETDAADDELEEADDEADDAGFEEIEDDGSDDADDQATGDDTRETDDAAADDDTGADDESDDGETEDESDDTAAEEGTPEETDDGGDDRETDDDAGPEGSDDAADSDGSDDTTADGEDADDEADEIPFYDVEITALDAETGESIEGATFHVADEGGAGLASGSIDGTTTYRSDDGGGEMVVTVEHDEYESETESITVDDDVSLTLELAPLEDGADDSDDADGPDDLETVPVGVETFDVDQGNPVEAVVSGERHEPAPNGEPVTFSVTTDPESWPAEVEVPPGSYDVEVESEEFIDETLEDVEIDDEHSVISAELYHDLDDVEIEFTVEDEAGDPIEDAEVSLMRIYPYQPDDEQLPTVTTDEDGAATVTVAEGGIDVGVEADGYYPDGIFVETWEDTSETIVLEAEDDDAAEDDAADDDGSDVEDESDDEDDSDDDGDSDLEDEGDENGDDDSVNDG